MEDPTLFPQLYQMMNPTDYSFHDRDFQSLSSESPNSLVERPVKQLKASSWNSSTTPPPPKASSSSSSSHIISFDNSNPSPQLYDVKPKTEVSNYWARNMGYMDQQCSNKSGRVSRSRTPLHAQYHVIADRKRREKLSQSFISLSKLIPGLKKTDKAPVLGDAIKYLKQLQDQVDVLEKQVANKTMESVIFARKTQIYADDENFHSQLNNAFPEMEARVSDRDVLIRILCNNNKECIPNIIDEVEKLHLCVLNTSVRPFGQATLDITIVAQMEAELSMTVKDLVKSLRLALLNFIK